MYTDILNIVIAFFEGLALIVSPCILPILPIVLAGSLTGKKSRPIGIIIGFIFLFTLATLFSRALIQFSQISEEIIRKGSYVILFLLGIMMLSTYLTDKFNLLTQSLTRVGDSLQTANNPESGLIGGIIFGCLIGVIWTPCAGPILAAVIVQVVLQKTTINSIFVVLAFTIGAGLPMLLIALLGRKIINTFYFFRSKTVLFRKLLGLIIILTVIYLAFFFNMPSSIQTSSSSTQITPTTLMNGLQTPYPAPNIEGIDAWINSPPLTAKDLKGKVVLVDFWTYSCINCIRTLPYIKNWYAKYHDRGFLVIGVHSPEFQFEHDLDNVKNAVVKDGILYPVALDNQFVTWKNFDNQYWPAHYLINQKGEIVYTHFGEGEYDITENNIRYLLGLNSSVSKQKKEVWIDSSQQTSETYFGYDRMERFSSPESIIKNQVHQYSYPTHLSVNHWALQGQWIIHPDKIISVSQGASIKLNFVAKNVYAVMGSPNHPTLLTIKLNGQEWLKKSGQNIQNNSVKVMALQLYPLITMQNLQQGTLELIATNPGLEMYTFTFGS